jgi:SAM-dependent methyltransferase
MYEGGILTQDGNPIDPDRLRAESFPEIRAPRQHLESPNALDPKQVVEQGYDRIAERHLEWIHDIRAEERARYTAVLLNRLPAGAEVLDLGCGAGVPTTRQLARRFRVTGVDISARQIAIARQGVPEAQFIHADITQLDFAPASFDAVSAFYAIIHVPRQEQRKLLRDIASWLRPGGLLVATMGAGSMKADYGKDFLGAPMYWSSFDSETNRRLVEEAGLHVVSAREEAAEEFGERVTFLWVVAQKCRD